MIHSVIAQSVIPNKGVVEEGLLVSRTCRCSEIPTDGVLWQSRDQSPCSVPVYPPSKQPKQKERSGPKLDRAADLSCHRSIRDYVNKRPYIHLYICISMSMRQSPQKYSSVLDLDADVLYMYSTLSMHEPPPR